jgi:hypothetical protein
LPVGPATAQAASVSFGPRLGTHYISKQHFSRHEYYVELMGGARRKPSLPIAGPAVTRHLAFWYPNDPTLKRAAWVKTIEKYILAIYRHLADQGLQPYTRSLIRGAQPVLRLLDNEYRLSGNDQEHPTQVRKDPTRYQTVRIRFYYGQRPASIGFELHDEYFTISTIIDLAWGPEPVPGEQSDCETTHSLVKAIEEFNFIATKRYELAKANTSEKAKSEHKSSFKNSYRFIYEDVWDSFYDRVFDQPYNAMPQADKERLGGTFVDLRGLVAVAGKSEFISPPVEREEKADFINPPASFAIQHSLTGRIGVDQFDDDDVVDRADVLLPWLKADRGFIDGDREADRTEPVEFSMTQFLDKRVLFATALGAQLSRKVGEQGALTFIMLAANPSRWQQGRLVDRVHMLATLRLAALYDLTHLINADAQLHKLEEKTKKFIAESTPKPRELRRKLPVWQRYLNETERQTKGGKAQIAGGLARRVERSGYYRRQFEDHLEGFRIDRIEGFAPIDEAVNRRLAGDYELIRTVGEHHARLRETLAGLSRRLQNRQIFELQQDIGHGTSAIERLQRNAEKAFFLFLFPYYFSQFLIHLAEEANASERLSPFDDAFQINIILAVASILIGITFAYGKSWEKMLGVGERISRAKFIVCLFASLIVATLFLTAIGTDPHRADHKHPPVAPPAVSGGPG